MCRDTPSTAWSSALGQFVALRPEVAQRIAELEAEVARLKAMLVEYQNKVAAFECAQHVVRAEVAMREAEVERLRAQVGESSPDPDMYVGWKIVEWRGNTQLLESPSGQRRRVEVFTEIPPSIAANHESKLRRMTSERDRLVTEVEGLRREVAMRDEQFARMQPDPRHDGLQGEALSPVAVNPAEERFYEAVEAGEVRT